LASANSLCNALIRWPRHTPRSIALRIPILLLEFTGIPL
jgi:hypothetical protein